MLNNDDRNRPALEAQQQYLDTEVHDTASADWLAVVDYLWQEFARTTTPRPRHDDDLAGLAARENAGYREAIDWAAQAATLEGTVSGLRAELAATLRRLEQEQERLAEVDRVRGTWVARSANQAQTIDSLRQQIASQERYLGNIAADLDREQEAHRRAMRDLETAREAAERYKGDHQRACETIAAMYEAGTGRKGQGPIRGVVEDVEDVRRDRDELLRRERERESSLETAREAAEQYRRDAVDAALRLGRIRKTLDD